MATIKKLDNGKTQVRGYTKPDPKTGESHEVKRNFDKPQDAKKFAAELEANPFYVNDKIKVREFIFEWLDGNTKLEDTTRAGYKQKINKHILPALGNYRVKEVSPAMLDKFYNRLMKDGLSPVTVKQIHRILSGFFKKSVNLQYATMNPCRFVDAPAQKKEEEFEATILTELQACQLLKALKGTVLYVPTLLALVLGVRRGEALGLRWQDIDFKKLTVDVCNTRTYAGKEYGIIKKLPKSLARLVQVDKVFLNILQKHRLIGSEYVCVWPDDGRLISPTSFSQMFKAAVEKINIPPVRFHDLRHTNVTIMRIKGVDELVVQKRVGHSSKKMTDKYTHYGVKEQAPAVKTISSLYK